MSGEIHAKKKRGRIPNKVKEQMRQAQELASAENIGEGSSAGTSTDLQPKKLSKRGRKQKEIKFKNITSKIEEFKMSETIVLCLPITYEKIIEINKALRGKELIQSSSEYSTKERLPIPHPHPENVVAHKKPTITNYPSQNAQGDQINIKIYDKIKCIPTEMHKKNLEKIKAIKVNIACWWCCHTFDTYPIPAPLKYDTKKEVFKVIGCFCSFSCSRAYVYSPKTYYYNREQGLF